MTNQHLEATIPTHDSVNLSNPKTTDISISGGRPSLYPELISEPTQMESTSSISTTSRISPLTSQLLDQVSSEEDNSIDEDDPLNVRELASNFDSLMDEINLKTEELASKVYNHVEAKKYNNDINIEAINSKLQQMRNLIQESNDLNMEIEKLDQLRLFTREFKDRLKTVTTAIKSTSKRR